GELQALVTDTSQAMRFPRGWSADGRLLFTSVNQVGGEDLWSLEITGDRRQKLVMPAPANSNVDLYNADVSRDGRYFAYTSQTETYVQPLAGGPRVQIPFPPARNPPHWRADGRELYKVANGQLMAAEFSYGAALDVGAVRPLFVYPANALNF